MRLSHLLLPNCRASPFENIAYYAPALCADAPAGFESGRLLRGGYRPPMKRRRKALCTGNTPYTKYLWDTVHLPQGSSPPPSAGLMLAPAVLTGTNR